GPFSVQDAMPASLDPHDHLVVPRVATAPDERIELLVHRAGDDAVPAAHAARQIDVKVETRPERGAILPLEIQDPSRCEHSFRAYLHAEAAADAVAPVDLRQPSAVVSHDGDRSRCGADHLACEAVIALLPGRFGKTP